MTGTAAATTAGRTRPDESTLNMAKRTLHVTPARMTMKTTAVSAERLRVRRRPGVHRHHEREHYRHHDDDQHREDRHTLAIAWSQRIASSGGLNSKDARARRHLPTVSFNQASRV